MRSIKLSQLDSLINHKPVILIGDTIPLAYLENVKVIKDSNNFLSLLDKPKTINAERIVIIDDNERVRDRFSIVNVKEDLFKPQLNDIIANKYEKMLNTLYSQKDIAKEIEKNINYDCIVLLLIDGLSYLDCRHIKNIRPCFVNGPTITEVGFKNIVNDPPIAYRLHNKGFKRRYGFTYWDRSNPLTDSIFKGFTRNQLFKVNEFDEITKILQNSYLNKTYIQILISGHDQVAHDHRGRPPVETTINSIFKDYINKLFTILTEKKLNSKIYLSADHGILWKPKISEDSNLIKINDTRFNSMRYAEGHIINDSVMHFNCYNKMYSSLKYPYIAKNYAVNEWGTHGGISMHESFVPFYVKEVSYD